VDLREREGGRRVDKTVLSWSGHGTDEKYIILVENPESKRRDDNI